MKGVAQQTACDLWSPTVVDELGCLLEEEGEADEMLAPMHAAGGERYVPFSSVMDSGASDHVTPADGAKSIQHEGEQKLPLVTGDGSAAHMVYQVAAVRRPLTSIAKLCDRGNRVMFGRGGGIVQNLQTGKVTPFRREGSIYMLDTWVDLKSPFGGRG